MPIGRKERQALKAQADAILAEEQAEAALWEDSGDKKTKARRERVSLKESKADAKHAARRDRRTLEEEEEAAAMSDPKGANRNSKITQAEVARRQALLCSFAETQKVGRAQVVPQPQLEENRNRKAGLIDATGLDAALAALEPNACNCPHEAQSYAEFEARALQQLQRDKPSMRMSQMKDHVAKMWTQSRGNMRRGRR